MRTRHICKLLLTMIISTNKLAILYRHEIGLNNMLTNNFFHLLLLTVNIEDSSHFSMSFFCFIRSWHSLSLQSLSLTLSTPSLSLHHIASCEMDLLRLNYTQHPLNYSSDHTHTHTLAISPTGLIHTPSTLKILKTLSAISDFFCLFYYVFLF